jgi:hypothetical protein
VSDTPKTDAAEQEVAEQFAEATKTYTTAELLASAREDAFCGLIKMTAMMRDKPPNWMVIKNHFEAILTIIDNKEDLNEHC